MKRYQITIDGRTFDVQVLGDPRQDQVQVAVDGEALTVEVRAVATGEEVGATGPLPYLAPGPLPHRAPGLAPSLSPPPSAVSLSGNTVTAPLPGVIKVVVVEPGQQVAAGDELLVIEAMKMDNVIRATRGGVVETINVTEGHQVTHGEPMLKYRR